MLAVVRLYSVGASFLHGNYSSFYNSMVDHFPLLEFPCENTACMQQNNAKYNMFMMIIVCGVLALNVVYTFGISTEASAPAVLSL